MAHQVDTQHQTPRVRQSHDKRLESIQLKPIIPNQIHRPHNPTPQHHRPIPPITPQRIPYSRPRLAVPRVAVLAQQRQDRPRQRKRQPVHDAPRLVHDRIAEPDPPCARIGVRARAAGEVDGQQHDDAGGQGDGEEDGDDDVRGRGAQGEVVAQEEEDEGADGEEGEGEEGGRAGGGGGGCVGGGGGGCRCGHGGCGEVGEAGCEVPDQGRVCIPGRTGVLMELREFRKGRPMCLLPWRHFRYFLCSRVDNQLRSTVTSKHQWPWTTFRQRSLWLALDVTSRGASSCSPK